MMVCCHRAGAPDAPVPGQEQGGPPGPLATPAFLKNDRGRGGSCVSSIARVVGSRDPVIGSQNYLSLTAHEHGQHTA